MQDFTATHPHPGANDVKASQQMMKTRFANYNPKQVMDNNSNNGK